MTTDIVFFCNGGIAATSRLTDACDRHDPELAWVAATELGWWLGWLLMADRSRS